MKVGIKSVLGSVIGASMFCACGPTPTVSGSLIATATEASPLKLDLTSVIQPEIFNLDASGNVNLNSHKQWKTYVADSQLDGYYYGCLGHENFEAWHMKIGTGNTGNIAGTNDYAHNFPLVQVAQSNYNCELRATAISRWVKSDNPLVQATYVDDLDTCGPTIFNMDGNGNPTTTLSPCVKKGIKEVYSFRQVTIDSNGVMTVNTTSKRESDHQGNPALYDSLDVVIRDGYDPNNLRMAVDMTAGPSNILPMALINISGLNTGDRTTGGKGGFGTAFQVNILTGSTAERLDAHQNPSQINFSKNELTSAKELPSPTYDLSTSTVRVAVDPDGYITPSSTGNFKFTVGVRNYVSVAGTEYIFGLPTDGTTCTSKTIGVANCSTDWHLNPNILPAGDTYRQMSEAEQYDALFTRWQTLRNKSRASRVINTSDKSISIPVLTMFPLTDGTDNGSGKLFDQKAGSTKLYEALHASMVVLIRNKAAGIQGSDYDSASGVISYQAFQIAIDPPVLP